MTTPTDRTIRNAADVEQLRFDESGLIPVVTQDAATGTVLMLAFADRTALIHTLETGEMHYWSRSRDELWRKGATSGHTQQLVSLHTDCDGDSVLALTRPAGAACHTGEVTCFGSGAYPELTVFGELWRTLQSRNRTRPEGSYTSKLLEDENLRLKKLGEEVAELISALAQRDRERVPEEAGDLFYHILVAILGAEHSVSEVARVLARRAGTESRIIPTGSTEVGVPE